MPKGIPHSGVRSPARHSQKAAIQATLPLGDVVRYARILAKLTQTELAEKMETRRSCINRLECGRAHVTTATLVRIGEAVGIPGWRILRMAERARAQAQKEVSIA